MALRYPGRRNRVEDEVQDRWIEPRLEPELRGAKSEVFDAGRKVIVDCAHVMVERLDTRPVMFSKVFKEFEDWKGQKYDYRYWAERENYFLREFLKKQNEFTHVVQARHLISENEAAKQVLTCDAGITIANWLRVKSRYADTATLSHPFQRSDAFLRLLRACLVALKQLHGHRIVHCDIKEDNICIPYAPNPLPADGGKIHLEFDKLKLIDFAFSVAHAIPLTQVLVINPEERVPYQSELLIAALHADRRTGSPNAVQQLDHRVDLFSLGYMAEKISAAGLECPPGAGGLRALADIRSLVERLKAFDSAQDSGSLPHDGLIAEVDRLLQTAGRPESVELIVEGEWTAEEMAQGRAAVRQTPLTPVALPMPTPVAMPLARAPRPSSGKSGIRIALVLGLALAAAAGGAFLYRELRDTGPPAPSSAAVVPQPAVEAPAPRAAAAPAPATNAAPAPRAPEDGGKRIASLLRSDDELVFQAAFGELSQLMAGNRPAAEAIAESIVGEYAGALASAGPQARRSLALARLMAMANAGNAPAGRQVAAFEKRYDEVKQTVATSTWWSRGQGSQPGPAARWIEDGGLLAQNGDRPAMLDQAFAIGHGRVLAQNRETAVETYLKVIARSDGRDEASTRIRQSAVRGLAVMLHMIVKQKDQPAARRLLPAVESQAAAVPAEMQSYLALFRQCAVSRRCATARRSRRAPRAPPGR